MTPVSVFYTPHSDDEVLGMGGAIAEAKAAGHRVVLVLVTDNLPSPRAIDLFTDRKRCHWHDRAKHALAHIDLAAARLLEFTECAASLGANEIGALGIPERLGVEDYPRFVHAIGLSIGRYAATYPGATHHVVSGIEDFDAATNAGNRSHAALAAAAQAHEMANGLLVVRHRVYIYSLAATQRVAPVTRHLAPEIMAAKFRAMEAYKVWAPETERIAYGYHSVRALFDAAASDAREFEEARA